MLCSTNAIESLNALALAVQLLAEVTSCLRPAGRMSASVTRVTAPECPISIVTPHLSMPNGANYLSSGYRDDLIRQAPI